MKQSVRQYTCIIIDDDFSSINLIKDYISMIPKLKFIRGYLNPLLAVADIVNSKGVDFLFLDVNMSISGLDVARIVRNKVKFIIMVTGHPEHALEAFHADADKFLVKPISFEKFLVTVNQVLIRAVS